MTKKLTDKIIGVDYSPNGTAWWISETDFNFFSMLKKKHSDDSRHIPIDDSMNTIEKVYYMAGIFSHVIQSKNIKVMCLESRAMFGSNQKEEYLSGYHILRYIMHLNGGRTIDVSPRSLKLYATGNGKAEKVDMIREAQNSLGDTLNLSVFGKLSDNIADSYFLRQVGVDTVTNKCYTEEHKIRALKNIKR